MGNRTLSLADSGKDTQPSELPAHLAHWQEWLCDLLAGYPDITRADSAEIRERISAFLEGPECEHRWDLRRLMASDGTARYVRECVICGAQTSQIAKAKLSPEQMEAAPLVTDSETRAARRGGRWSAIQAVKMQMLQEVGERIRGEAQREYQDYLHSPHWLRIRRRRMEMANGICEGCGEKPATEVHHLTYDHRGYEMLWELRAVCRECHDVIHGAQS